MSSGPGESRIHPTHLRRLIIGGAIGFIAVYGGAYALAVILKGILG
jgi:hypothetical protein